MEGPGFGAQGANKYQYNGKELNSDFGLNWNDYGARFYDAAVGRWNAIDRLSEKYFSIAPYAYAANNPIKYIDPNGQEVWIYYNNSEGKEDKVLYSANMKYEGKDKFVQAAVKYLNGMNSSKSGASVLKDLIVSKNTFDFKNTPSAGGDMSLQFNYRDDKGKILSQYEQGGGEIKAAALLNDKITEYQQIDNVAHEAFHGFQRENGRLPGGTNAEVEAYLFGRGVAATSDFPPSGFNSFGNGTKPAGEIYDKAMESLFYNGYDSKSYEQAVNNFVKGSGVNATGVYNNLKPYPGYQPLINKFIPF